MIDGKSFAEDFFGTGEVGAHSYSSWMRIATGLLSVAPDSPAYSGASPERLSELLTGEICPEIGVGQEVLKQRLEVLLKNSIAPWHPFTAAHLHTPVLSSSLAAEAILTAINQSMDSFDQAPAASVLEQKVIGWLCELAGFPPTASGTFTAGGTQSNYMGLLLARDHFLLSRIGWCAREKGLPRDANKMRFLCSEVSHFSVEKSAIQLGLGTQAVRRIACDEDFRMCPETLRAEISALLAEGLWPVAIVATAGTTDFGSIDPLREISDIAHEYGIWLHVDAAYGGALLLTDRYRPLLAGVEKADSLTIDFHKAFFQPISCSAFLLADQDRFETIRVNADYLNSEDRETEGIPDLVTRSVLTTRRFDALKLWMSLQALGRQRFGAMIERLADLALIAARHIRNSTHLELVAWPQFGTVVFRFRPGTAESRRVNEQLPQHMFAEGRAVVGHTVVRGEPALKLTLCNPVTEEYEIRELLDAITACGTALITKVQQASPCVY
ncbi:MAG TPA: aspartate aminotransferase family protein [Bryobacteraceae bacterium]|nr:aspartate aminotransferase family protein [Bryobacteraceae bacterium]